MDVIRMDYRLYLVTDATDAILGRRNLCEVVEAAIRGGVTIVQLRDKQAGTADLINTARKLLVITRRAGIPLLINDRVDVALASGADGVHIGQDDIDLQAARNILGPRAIIGVTVNGVQEALRAVEIGADYLGIGTVFATNTKQDALSIIGTSGVRRILAALEERNSSVKTVCIGGLNASNVQRVIFQTSTPSKSLDGIAVVSAIIAADRPQDAAANLRALIDSPPPFATATFKSPLTRQDFVSATSVLAARISRQKPVCHNMTNTVVQNFAANIAIAIGASPIMSNNGAESSDLAAAEGSLVVNMGTTTSQLCQEQIQAITAYNALGVPVLLDPVGAAATTTRRKVLASLMHGGYFDVIKGNESEIMAVEGSTASRQQGVDSTGLSLTLAQKITLTRNLALRERNIIVMTGVIDVVSDGERTCLVKNGCRMLGEITGSGCVLGTVIASFLALKGVDKLTAVVSGMVMFELAAERAAANSFVKGPGSFISALLDELYSIRQECLEGDDSWAQAADIEIV